MTTVGGAATRAIGAALVLYLGLVAGATAQPYEEGVQYQLLPVPVQTASNDRVEVVEVFSYACVHCYNFEPLLHAWVERQGNGIVFRRTPAVFNKTWEQLAQAYYAAEALDVTEQIHEPMFNAIHRDGIDVLDPDVLSALFVENAGVDPAEFAKVYRSFGVRSKVQQASARGRAYRVTGVPTMIVNGKYRVDGRMAEGSANMLSVVEFLIAKERQGAAPDLAAGSE